MPFVYDIMPPSIIRQYEDREYMLINAFTMSYADASEWFERKHILDEDGKQTLHLQQHHELITFCGKVGRDGAHETAEKIFCEECLEKASIRVREYRRKKIPT